jgi:hypothetical protein
MFKTLFRIAALAGAVFFAGGSATIIKGTSQPVTITTSPPGATVYVDQQPVGVSPITVSLKHADHAVSASLPGYGPGYARLTTSFSGWSLLAFPLGMIVDAITGAISTLDQDAVVIQLAPGAAPPAGPAFPQQPAPPQPDPNGASPQRR